MVYVNLLNEQKVKTANAFSLKDKEDEKEG